MKFVCVLFPLFLFTFACNKADNHEENVDVEILKCSTQEDFGAFFIKFHSDSIFQMNRVVFPLEGYKSEGGEDDAAFYWNKEEWMLHQNTKIDTTVFTEEKIISETEVIHKVYIKDSGFYIERVFYIIDCKWYLVFYLERLL